MIAIRVMLLPLPPADSNSGSICLRYAPLCRLARLCWQRCGQISENACGSLDERAAMRDETHRHAGVRLVRACRSPQHKRVSGGATTHTHTGEEKVLVVVII